MNKKLIVTIIILLISGCVFNNDVNPGEFQSGREFLIGKKFYGEDTADCRTGDPEGCGNPGYFYFDSTFAEYSWPGSDIVERENYKVQKNKVIINDGQEILILSNDGMELTDTKYKTKFRAAKAAP